MRNTNDILLLRERKIYLQEASSDYFKQFFKNKLKGCSKIIWKYLAKNLTFKSKRCNKKIIGKNLLGVFIQLTITVSMFLSIVKNKKEVINVWGLLEAFQKYKFLKILGKHPLLGSRFNKCRPATFIVLVFPKFLQIFQIFGKILFQITSLRLYFQIALLDNAFIMLNYNIWHLSRESFIWLYFHGFDGFKASTFSYSLRKWSYNTNFSISISIS